MEHSLTGERSWHMENYDLHATDVQESMRNFPGYDEKEYYTLEEIRKGDTHGMTETDQDTSGHNDGPYTEINQKKGKYGHAPKNKLSAKVDMYNNEKPRGIKSPLKTKSR